PSETKSVKRSLLSPWRPQASGGLLEDRDALMRAKKFGFSDGHIASPATSPPVLVRAARQAHAVLPTYRLVDTCAAEFEAFTPYYYSTYGDENQRRDSGKREIR